VTEAKITENPQLNSVPSDSAQAAPTEVTFPPKKQSPPCSENICANGHSWPPTLALSSCTGCGSPVLAMLMENCPYCNEPTQVTRLRTDHFPSGGQVVKACKGQVGSAEITIIELERTHAVEVESRPSKKDAPCA
jgi:hypothetical protein